MRALRCVLALIVCAGLLGGCGLLHGRGSSTTSRSGSGPVAVGSAAAARSAAGSTTTAAPPDDDDDAPPEHEDGPAAAQAAQLPASAASPTPQASLARFAQLYVNWSASQLPVRSRQLASLSVGQAHVEALQFGSRAPQLEQFDVTNSGTVVAVAPGQGQEHGRWVVITNELTSGAGPYLGLPAVSHVTWATVLRQDNGYVVSGWYPAS
jgi:hypothetical protein